MITEATVHVDFKRFGCKVLLHRFDHHSSDYTLLHYWKDFNFHQFNKWKWFFRYRAALAQVKHPTRFVEIATFSYTYVPSAEELRKRLKDRLTAKKAKLTTYLNKLAAYEKAWTSMFPITDDIPYQLALAKIEKVRRELDEMQREYDNYQAN
ncbi:hypothetical protein A6C57_23295 [Fibrella sp. ES10-3-2-2]|nr:hypothetical protein A6C57_23295 [Fibrella sp. ES10-3-2-2]